MKEEKRNKMTLWKLIIMIYQKNCKNQSKQKWTQETKNVIKRKGANSYDNIRKSARSYSKYKFKPICMNCGYDKHYEVCHIKDIKDFDHTISTVYDINNENNLLHLCPNCHMEVHNPQLKL